jgi:hypothetical protein
MIPNTVLWNVRRVSRKSGMEVIRPISRVFGVIALSGPTFADVLLLFCSFSGER